MKMTLGVLLRGRWSLFKVCEGLAFQTFGTRYSRVEELIGWLKTHQRKEGFGVQGLGYSALRNTKPSTL